MYRARWLILAAVIVLIMLFWPLRVLRLDDGTEACVYGRKFMRKDNERIIYQVWKVQVWAQPFTYDCDAVFKYNPKEELKTKYP